MKIDKSVDKLFKRLDNIISGTLPASEWDSTSGPSFDNNWDMINALIAENPENGWYIPNDNIINAWASPITRTVGNIDLRDFKLERKFADMRHERVEEYDRKWQEAIDNNDTDYLSNHRCPALSSIFWKNWTNEEKAYYSNEERFPILKNGYYKPMWDLNHPNWHVSSS